MWLQCLGENFHSEIRVAGLAAGEAIPEDGGGFGVGVEAGVGFSEDGDCGDALGVEFVGGELEDGGTTGGGGAVGEVAEECFVV